MHRARGRDLSSRSAASRRSSARTVPAARSRPSRWLPGEKTRLAVKTYKRSTATATEASSILDSSTAESQDDFEIIGAGNAANAAVFHTIYPSDDVDRVNARDRAGLERLERGTAALTQAGAGLCA